MKAVGGEKPAGLQVVGLVGGTQRPPPADDCCPPRWSLGVLPPQSLAVTGGAHTPFPSCLSGLAAQWRQLCFRELPEGTMRKGTEANIVQHPRSWLLSSEDSSNTLSILHHGGALGWARPRGKASPA